VEIDEDELLEAVVRVVNEGNPAHAGNVRVKLGKIADDGEYFDEVVVAADLAELESLGKLELDRRIDWGGSEPMPKTRIAYVLRSEQK
jgi:hypothetical protein